MYERSWCHLSGVIVSIVVSLEERAVGLTCCLWASRKASWAKHWVVQETVDQGGVAQVWWIMQQKWAEEERTLLHMQRWLFEATALWREFRKVWSMFLLNDSKTPQAAWLWLPNKIQHIPMLYKAASLLEVFKSDSYILFAGEHFQSIGNAHIERFSFNLKMLQNILNCFRRMPRNAPVFTLDNQGTLANNHTTL